MQTAKNLSNKLLNAALPVAGLFLTFTLAGLRTFAADVPGTNAPASAAFSETATEWIDAATGHRVIRLSNEPGSLSLYFHQNAYTPQGDKMIIYTPEGLATVNLKTRAVELVAPGVRYGPGSSSSIEVGRKTPTVYYEKNEDGQTVIYATDMDTKATRVVSKLGFTGDFGGVNADETLIIGKCTAPGGVGGQGPGTITNQSQAQIQAQLPSASPSATTNAPAPGRRGGRGGGGGRALQFFAVDVKTGAVRTFMPMTDNLNHDQCSPTDPSLILYCHEGAWDQVDRIWTIRTDGTGNRLMHPRTMPMEIAGHEFFGYDGETVWYDLQTPKSGVFWLAGVNVQTGERIRYPLERSQWSVHYNQSHDGKLFAGDGGGPNGVSNRHPDGTHFDPPANGQWLYLFTPRPGQMDTMKVGNDDVKIGKFDVEKLVDLSKHNYTLEPNLTFTPDNKWIVFRSNIQGGSQVYAVEIAKAK
jgi:oligogalacturonide lyase